MLTYNQTEIKTLRKVELTPKILIIDGLPGCGKTMLSPIVSALERVEKLTFAFELEIMCQLVDLGKMDEETAQTTIRIFTDMKLYNTMMGREVNFRMKDLSGVLMDGQPWRYIRRIFGPGDETVPARVEQQQPILHLTTHQLLSYGHPVFKALKDRLLLVDVVRHPLYMIKQQTLNMEKLIADARYFNVHFDYKGHEIPWWTKGWEDLFLKCNAVEKAVYSIVYMGTRTTESYGSLPKELKENVLIIPFECFVLDPWPYMDQISSKLGTKIIPATLKMMKKQNVPRKKIAQGLDLPIYRRCGWKPAKAGASEEEELADRRNWMLTKVNPEAMRIFDERCKEYERAYLGGVKEILGRK
jgi:hypothetical protein